MLPLRGISLKKSWNFLPIGRLRVSSHTSKGRMNPSHWGEYSLFHDSVHDVRDFEGRNEIEFFIDTTLTTTLVVLIGCIHLWRRNYQLDGGRNTHTREELSITSITFSCTSLGLTRPISIPHDTNLWGMKSRIFHPDGSNFHVASRNIITSNIFSVIISEHLNTIIRVWQRVLPLRWVRSSVTISGWSMGMEDSSRCDRCSRGMINSKCSTISILLEWIFYPY